LGWWLGGCWASIVSRHGVGGVEYFKRGRNLHGRGQVLRGPARSTGRWEHGVHRGQHSGWGCRARGPTLNNGARDSGGWVRGSQSQGAMTTVPHLRVTRGTGGGGTKRTRHHAKPHALAGRAAGVVSEACTGSNQRVDCVSLCHCLTGSLCARVKCCLMTSLT
jgi:hypothetical protein